MVEFQPNVGNNPLLGHGGWFVNAIEFVEQTMKLRVKDVKTPMKTIFEEMHKVGMI